MADSDKSGGGGEPPVRDVPIDWEALEDAFENNAPEVHSYLHLASGEVLRVVDGIADPEMHARITSDASYVRVEPVSSREQYRWMERFIPMIEDNPLREQLAAAIDGKGAFRRFKDVLMSFGPERERWFAFRSERLRAFMDAWLTTHHLRPVPRAAASNNEAPPHESPAIPQDLLTTRRTRTAEVMRKQLRDLAETLGARDLEKITAFAEFIKARRAARGFAHRPDGSEPSDLPPADGTSERLGDADEDEEPVSTSRKQTLAK